MKSASFIRPFILSLLLAMGLASCAEKRPDYLVPQDKMVDVLKEMQIAYAGVDVTLNDESARQRRYDELNALILDKFKMNADTFSLTYNYYLQHPEMLDSLYKLVTEELNLEMVQLQQKGGRAKGRVLEGQ